MSWAILIYKARDLINAAQISDAQRKANPMLNDIMTKEGIPLTDIPEDMETRLRKIADMFNDADSIRILGYTATFRTTPGIPDTTTSRVNKRDP